MIWLLLISVFVSFLLVVLVLPKWIQKCRKIGLVWEDMNKFGHPKNVASSGGVMVVLAFVLGVLSYVALKTFVFGGTVNALEIFALLSVILILGIAGLTDDLLGWKNQGLSIKMRLLLALVASIPLVVINAGTNNFLAGYNGLEAGQGVLIISFLSYVAYVTGSPWLAIIGLCMVAALFGFYIFNKFPAKVFPGDTMTYAIGALIAGMAILGNFEKVAVVVFIPYIIEVILKSRGGLKKHSFGKPRKDGTLELPYDRIYGLEHLAIWVLGNRATERKVTYLIHAFQIVFILVAFLML